MIKIIILAITATFVSTLYSCRKNKTGNAVFWQKSGSGYSTTVVSIDGVSSNISSEYNTSPSCGASGCAVFNNLELGSHEFTASDGTYFWSGVIYIFKNECLQRELE